MKKKILIVVFAVTMLSGCYTRICHTYAIKPEKQQDIKAMPDQETQQKEQKSPS